jgi:hypothetical protein
VVFVESNEKLLEKQVHVRGGGGGGGGRVKDRGNAGDRRCWRSKQGGCVESAGVCGHFAGGVGARAGDDGNARRRALSHRA